MQLHISTNTATAWKNSHFILSERSDFLMVDNLSIALHALPKYMLTSLSVDEILLPKYINWSTNFRRLTFNDETVPSWLKHINWILSVFTKQAIFWRNCYWCRRWSFKYEVHTMFPDFFRMGTFIDCHHHHHHHHHHVVPQTRISLTLSRHFSLSFIASGRSSGPHPVSSQSCWMYVWAGRPAFARPYVGVHRSTSLMSSSLLLQQWPACLVRLTWIVFVMGGRWPYSWCFVGCCRQDLFNIARNILV